jgi:hypothetical protein
MRILRWLIVALLVLATVYFGFAASLPLWLSLPGGDLSEEEIARRHRLWIGCLGAVTLALAAGSMAAARWAWKARTRGE